jgi:hypothetical protein
LIYFHLFSLGITDLGQKIPDYLIRFPFPLSWIFVMPLSS